MADVPGRYRKWLSTIKPLDKGIAEQESSYEDVVRSDSLLMAAAVKRQRKADKLVANAKKGALAIAIPSVVTASPQVSNLTIEESTNLDERVKLQMLKDATGVSLKECETLKCTHCNSTAHMVRMPYGFKCPTCSSMFGWNLETLVK